MDASQELVAQAMANAASRLLDRYAVADMANKKIQLAFLLTARLIPEADA
jgi:hypothetical protein